MAKKCSWADLSRVAIDMRETLSLIINASESPKQNVTPSQIIDSTFELIGVAVAKRNELWGRIGSLSDGEILMGSRLDLLIILSGNFDPMFFPDWLEVLAEVGVLSGEFAKLEAQSN